MSLLGIQQHTDMNKLLFGSETVPKKRGVKKILHIGSGESIQGNNGAVSATLTGSSCGECVLKNSLINALNLKISKMESQLSMKKDEEKVKKEKQQPPPMTEEEQAEAKRIKDEKDLLKKQKKEHLVKIEDENRRLKAELLTRFGVTL